MSSFEEYKAMRLPAPLQFGLSDIERAVQDHETIIQLQAEGFRAYSQGRVSVAPIQSMGQPPFHAFVAGPDAQTCVKSGYVEGEEHYVIKIAPGGVRENEKRNLPVNTGLNLLLSQRTTRLEAIFFDEGLLTEIRTAAAAALAARLLAPCGESLKEIGIIGSGVQACWQLRLLKAVTPCRRALVHSRTPARAARLCEAMRAEGWDISTAAAEEVAARCQLIHTTTPSRAPLLRAGWLPARGLHVNAMGADTPGKQELEPALVARADLLVCDSRAQTAERGEFQEALAQGLVEASRVLEVGELLDRPELHRQGPGDQRLTVFDSSGVAVQDVMITQMVYQALAGPRSHL